MGIGLVKVDRAAAAWVPRVKEEVDVLLRHLEPHAQHRRAELLTRDLTVAVLVPLPEEVHDPPRVLEEGLLELLAVRVRVRFRVRARARARARVRARVKGER